MRIVEREVDMDEMSCLGEKYLKEQEAFKRKFGTFYFFLLLVYTMRSWLMASVMFRGQKSCVCSIQKDLWIGWTQGNLQLRSGRTRDVILCSQGGHGYYFFRHYSWIVLRCVGFFFGLQNTFERFILSWAMERSPLPRGRLFRNGERGGVSICCWGCACSSTTRMTLVFTDTLLVMQTEFKGMENCKWILLEIKLLWDRETCTVEK